LGPTKLVISSPFSIQIAVRIFRKIEKSKTIRYLCGE